MVVGLALGLALLAACTAQRLPPAATPPAAATVTTATLPPAYLAAVADARQPEAAEIDRQLVALLPGTPPMIWNREGRVLMVTWTKAAHYPPATYQQGHIFPLPVDLWLTAAPFAQAFCSAYYGDLDLRLKQLLGLPPTDHNDVFVELWIKPQDIFRPCPDPEISDHECQLRIPLAEPQPEPGPEGPPWHCPPPGEHPQQLSAAYVEVRPSHLDWMCANWQESYHPSPMTTPYPWTALGYTYDWGNPWHPRGLSEFVAPKGTTATFHASTPTTVYCAAEHRPVSTLGPYR